MKVVDLFGFTTAEKLIAFEKAINDLYSELGNLGLYVSKEGYVSDTYMYNTSYLTGNPAINSFIGRPIYFVNSGYVAYVNTYNAANGDFTVEGGYNVKGPKGDDGKNGIDGAPGIPGTNGADGESVTNVIDGESYQEDGFTVTPVTMYVGEEALPPVLIKAKNGEGEIAGSKLYKHRITVTGTFNGKLISFFGEIINSSDTPFDSSSFNHYMDNVLSIVLGGVGSNFLCVLTYTAARLNMGAIIISNSTLTFAQTTTAPAISDSVSEV